MIKTFEPDGKYRPYPYVGPENGFVVRAYIIHRGSINEITYSEPCLTNHGHPSTAPYFFPTIWAAERKCRQLNGDTSDPDQGIRIPYANLAPKAGSIGSMPNI